jgi:hypothetical protein
VKTLRSLLLFCFLFCVLAFSRNFETPNVRLCESLIHCLSWSFAFGHQTGCGGTSFGEHAFCLLLLLFRSFRFVSSSGGGGNRGGQQDEECWCHFRGSRFRDASAALLPWVPVVFNFGKVPAGLPPPANDQVWCLVAGWFLCATLRSRF